MMSTVLLAFVMLLFCTMGICPIAATFWKMDYDHQRMAQAQTAAAAQQWTNNIQTSDAGALIYIPMSSQYPATAHEASNNNNHNNYIAQRNHLFANRPATKSIIRRPSTAAAQSNPLSSASLQYSPYTHLPATVQVHHPYPQQLQQQYSQQLSNAQPSVDEYLLHGEMPLPQDQTYIVSNAAPESITTSTEPDYLT